MIAFISSQAGETVNLYLTFRQFGTRDRSVRDFLGLKILLMLIKLTIKYSKFRQMKNVFCDQADSVSYMYNSILWKIG